MNPKQELLSMMKDGNKQPNWMGYGFEAFPKIMFHCVIDPISIWDILFINGVDIIDNWGVNHRFIPEEYPGVIPMVNESNQVIKDITKWRDYVNFPKIPDNLDWSAAKEQIKGINRDEQFIMVPTFRGAFERLHCLMTFENTLMALYEDPDDCYDFFGEYINWKLKVVEQLIDELQPDIIHSHDDWGSKEQLFFAPSKFKDLFFDHYKKLYDYIKSRGVLIQHHCDSYMMGLEGFLVELGVDMWQGALPSNDINAMKKNTGGKLLYMGGIDQGVIDHKEGDVTEDVIRAEVRRAIDTYAPGGSFVPVVGSIECLNTWVTPVVIDECNRYGAEWAAKNKKA